MVQNSKLTTLPSTFIWANYKTVLAASQLQLKTQIIIANIYSLALFAQFLTYSKYIAIGYCSNLTLYITTFMNVTLPLQAIAN